MGEQGVIETLRIIHNELDISMGLCGIRDVREVNRSNLLLPEIL
jgi:L-lactate dehydrogenase (cytochrome)